jgi:hypothetical protein
VRSFWGTLVTRFFVFCCNLDKLLAPLVDSCVVVAGARAVGRGAPTVDDTFPESFLIPLSDDKAFDCSSAFSSLFLQKDIREEHERSIGEEV